MIIKSKIKLNITLMFSAKKEDIMGQEELKKMEEQEPVFDEERFRKRFVFSFSLFFIFAATYFLAAVLTTKELKAVAAFDIIGLPLAVWLGVIVFAVGVVVTRLYLVKILKGWG
jgi:uncharacterized membrane protein (DUF485 family)